MDRRPRFPTVAGPSRLDDTAVLGNRGVCFAVMLSARKVCTDSRGDVANRAAGETGGAAGETGGAAGDTLFFAGVDREHGYELGSYEISTEEV